jgi:hypothetical protein
MTLQPGEEGKLLSEALNTVKIQVQQMKRHLVSPYALEYSLQYSMFINILGVRSAYGCFEER